MEGPSAVSKRKPLLMVATSAVAVLALPGCAGSASAQAFERYVDCSEQVLQGDALGVVPACWAPHRLEEIQGEDVADFLISTRATALRLLDSQSVVVEATSDAVASEYETIELRIVGFMDGVPAAIRVGMERIEGEWYIATESFDVKGGAVVASEARPPMSFEVRENGRVVLDSNSGVWRGVSSGAIPTFIVDPYFDGPTLQIDNLGAATVSQRISGMRDASVFKSNPEVIGVEYRTAGGPARVDGGELLIDGADDGHISGRLLLIIEPGRAGVIEQVEVEVSFANVPVG